jgi:hypothetical protein
MRTKLAVLAAILATSIMSPAFAGSSNDDQTTAAKLDEVSYVINEDQPTAAKLDEVAYQSNDDQTTAAKLDEVVFRASILSAPRMAPRFVDYSDNPNRTGGGSSGYNSHLRQDYNI